MAIRPCRWEDLDSDQPIPKLTRRMLKGEQMLVANVQLAQGCHVALHRHESEQIAIMLSGRVRWTIGPEGGDQDQFEMTGGQVLRLPSNVWHGVEVLEDTQIFDILSPPGTMGVDSQDA